MDYVERTQLKFNNAFTAYKQTEDKKYWDEIFLILMEVCTNVAKSMLEKRGVYSADFYEKVTDCVCNIMRLYIQPKKADVRFLGSFVRGYIMNAFWSKTVRNHEFNECELKEELCYVPNENEYILIQGRILGKKELIKTINKTVSPTQIKKIIENRIKRRNSKKHEQKLLEQKSKDTE